VVAPAVEELREVRVVGGVELAARLPEVVGVVDEGPHVDRRDLPLRAFEGPQDREARVHPGEGRLALLLQEEVEDGELLRGEALELLAEGGFDL